MVETIRWTVCAGLVASMAGCSPGTRPVSEEATGEPGPPVEESGLVALETAEVEKRFVLRHPADLAAWNGGLLVAAHGGSGGPALAADGTQIGTSQSYAAEGAGTPVAARPLWPFIGSSSSVSGLERAWHISREDDALEGFRYRMSEMGIGADARHAAGEYGSYVRAVRDALDLVDAWVTNGVPAPDDRTVDDGEGIALEE
jgi:hypothetical protein